MKYQSVELDAVQLLEKNIDDLLTLFKSHGYAANAIYDDSQKLHFIGYKTADDKMCKVYLVDTGNYCVFADGAGPIIIKKDLFESIMDPIESIEEPISS